jgi:hypothetical protein
MPKWRQWETTSEADWTLALERESVVSEQEAEAIGQASMRWPLPLSQRFASALRYRTQKRWRYTPYRATMNSCKQFDYAEVAGLRPKPKTKGIAPGPNGLEGHESVRDLRAKSGQQCAI